MDKTHHYKMILLAGILLLVVVAILGIMMFFGKARKPALPVGSGAESQYQKLIKAATAKSDYSIADPEIQKLIKNASAPSGAKLKDGREALIRAATAI